MFSDFFAQEWHLRLPGIAGVIIGAFLFYRLLRFILYRYDKKRSEKTQLNSSRYSSYNKLALSLVRSALIVTVILLVLKLSGFNIRSLVAGLGLASVVVGFALQDGLKDIIRGAGIIGDAYFHIGDVIRYKGEEGEVISMSLRTTKIRSLYTKNIISIANRNLEDAEVVSTFYFEKVPLPYDLKVYQAEKVVKDIVDRIQKNEYVDSVRYIGVTELAESCINYYLEIRSEPVYRRQVRRDTLRSILLGMEANNVAVPFSQLDIHSIDDAERRQKFAELTDTPKFREFEQINKYASSDSLFRTEKYKALFDGENTEKILDGVENFTWRMGCTKKEKLQIRLLTEEILELVRNTSAQSNLEVSYTEKGRICTIRARIDSEMDGDIKDRVHKLAEAEKTAESNTGMINRMSGMALKLLTSDSKQDGQVWSLKEYVASLQEDGYSGSSKEREYAMEELEHSIIANLADDVKVKFNHDQLVIEAVKNF